MTLSKESQESQESQESKPSDTRSGEAGGPAGRLAGYFIGSKLTPLLVAAALALGLLSVAQTPREEEPQIVVPVFDLFVGLPGATPTEVESRVAQPLEKRMWQIPGVEYVYSASREGGAMVTVRFLVGDDEEESLVKVMEELAAGLAEAPPDATPPLVKSRSIDDVPVLALTLWGAEHDGYALRRYAGELRRELASLQDVSEIEIVGGERRQLRVQLDAERLASVGLDPGAIVRALEMQNASAPAGSYERDNREVLVETGGFLRSAEEVRSLVVGVAGGESGRGGPVRLRDVAEVLDGPEDPASYVFFLQGAGAGSPSGGIEPAVTLTLAKRKGADAHRVVGRVMDKVEDQRGALLPEDLEITVTRDYGATADEKAGELLLHLVIAILSVSVLIGLFLGWRGALVVFVSVPVSFALTLFVYYLFGYTLNRVTLFALIFVTGIVVDDSIIVVENIVRHFAMRKKGTSRLAAALEAVSEVGNPTILATLTVIASVLPMAFVRGLMGPYMRPMPVGASLAMAFSLLVALIVAPWLAYRLMRSEDSPEDAVEDPPEDTEDISGDVAELDEGVPEGRTHRVYRSLLAPLLASRAKAWTFLGVTFLLLLASVALVPLRAVNLKMLPFDNKSELQVILDLPEGTTLESTSEVAQEIAHRLVGDAAYGPQITDVQIYAGTAAPINFNGLVRHYDLRSGAHVADLQVNFLHKEKRALQSHDLAKRLRPLVQEIAERHGAAAKVVEVPPGPPVLSTLVAEVYGPSEAERIRVAKEVRELFARTPGIVDVDWMVEAPQRKLRFEVDREKAAIHGVPVAAVARSLRLALAGEDVDRLHLDDEAEPVAITVELPRAERSSAHALAGLRLRSLHRGVGGPSLVPLSELVRVEEATLATTRHRKNLQPVVYVTADVAGGAESPVYSILDLSDDLEKIELAAGGHVGEAWISQPGSTERATVKWDGEWHITYEVFRDLGAAFGAVLVLIYFLIVGWFGSFRVPLVMMIAIPLSLVGILPGHWIFGAFFTATSMIGFIALAGIMVRNSVLLIDFIDLALERGYELEEAVIQAGSVRFRPILLTAGTVVVGAVVILFDPIFQGLAIALMFGAVASTALTLIVVPLVYHLVEHRAGKTPSSSEQPTQETST